MSKAKIKDDLALLITGVVVSIVGWWVFQLLGMYTFLVGIAAWFFVSIQHWKRIPKSMEPKDTDRKG